MDHLGTPEEKFKLMKAQLVRRHQWSEERETALKEAFGIVDPEPTAEVVETPVEVKPTKRPAGRPAKKQVKK